MRWTFRNIPDQTSKIAIVTGANTGIGYETSRALALKGAHVILACRHRERGEAAANRIRAEHPAGTVEFAALDLSSLDSIRNFAAAIRSRPLVVDILINNAGIMIPDQGTTSDGFELQIGINHLGHFALTGLVLESMRDSLDGRVVTLSSLAHRTGRIAFDSFTGKTGYNGFRGYRQSKLANLLFALEFHRRLRSGPLSVHSLAAHPGITHTELVRHKRVFNAIAKLTGMSAQQGALPTLFAATAPEAGGGEYYGPDGFHEMRGYPALARVMPQARDPEVASRLWSLSEDLTGVRFRL